MQCQATHNVSAAFCPVCGETTYVGFGVLGCKVSFVCKRLTAVHPRAHGPWPNSHLLLVLSVWGAIRVQGCSKLGRALLPSRATAGPVAREVWE